MTIYRGKVIKLADDIDTDIIIPTQYMTLETIEEMAKYAFTPVRKYFYQLVKKGDVIVTGENFGCGSSREQAVEIIKELGISCIIAKSFARIFYRNSINNGLLLIENREIYHMVSNGVNIEIDLDNRDITTENACTVKIVMMPEKLLKILESGGLTNYYRKINRGLS